MIKKVLSISKTTEVDTLTSSIITGFLQSSHTAEPYLSKIIHNLQPLSILLNKAINRIKSKSTLKEKDKLRDAVFRSFFYILSGYTYKTDEKLKDLGITLLNIYAHYGLNTIRTGYNIKTALINSFLMDLNNAITNANLTALPTNIEKTVEALKTAQHNFETGYLSYKKEKAKEKNYENATALKTQIIKIINTQLVNYLKAMMVTDSDTYTDFAQLVESLITDNNKNVKQRSSKNTAAHTTS